jgi:hypothetical protein
MKVQRGQWPAGSVAGSIDSHGQRQIMFFGERYMASNLAWLMVNNEWPIGQIDHVNVINNDDRIINLRLSTQSQNKANSKVYKSNVLGVKGVSPRQNGKFIAQIQSDKKKIFLGYHNTIEEAAAAYKEAALKLYGEFSRTE